MIKDLFQHHRERNIALLVGGLTVVTALFLSRNWVGTKYFSGGKNISPEGSSALNQGAGNEPQVHVYTIKKQNMKDELDGLVGTVKGDTLQLTFGGQEEKLTAVHVKVGQIVPKGKLLCEADHTRVRARKKQAEAAYQRAKDLQKAGGFTQRDLVEAESALEVAKKDYEDTFIYAPKKSYVSNLNKHVGESVSRSETIATLVSVEDPLYLETGVVEGQIDQVQEGQESFVKLESFPAVELKGKVIGVSREVTMTGRTGTVLVSLPQEVQSKLRPGLSGRCRVLTIIKDALPIPRSAYDAQRNGVYLCGPDNKITFKEVMLGHVTQDFLEVPSELEGSDIVDELDANPVDDGQLVAVHPEKRTYVSKIAKATEKND